MSGDLEAIRLRNEAKFGGGPMDPRTQPQDRGQRALAERLDDHFDLPVEDAQRITAAILGEHGVYLPDGPLDAEQWARHVAELERLQRIEAAARLKRNVRFTDGARFRGEWVAVPVEDFDALRAALEQD